MRKAAKQILACAAALFFFCVLSRIFLFNQFSVYIPAERTAEEAGQGKTRAESERPDVLRAGGAERRGRYERIRIYPEKPGETGLRIRPENGDGDSYHVLRVDRFRTVYDMNTGNFTGDTAVMIAVTLFWGLVSAIMLWHFFQAKGSAFYDYATIYYAGFSLFTMESTVVMLSVTVSHIAHPESFYMYSVYSAISGAGTRFMTLTSPLMLLFAAAMAVSNIALLKHERTRLKNMAGLLISVTLIAGEALGWYLVTRDFSGSEREVRIRTMLQNTYASFFVYFQCMLTGSVICGLLAAKRRPAPDKDFIIILGCWFRGDGTLPPLLRGRADKALEFWRRQKEETGKEARFIPSGGQGGDEPMPEAEAVRRYLLAEGVQDRLILPENRSRNTYQNMAYSGEIIRETGSGGKTVFATSSYHVFRSGIQARQAGLAAEGMGSRTKWWFWPNAFMRETAGLLLKRWRQEILLLVLMLAFFDLLCMTLG